MMRTIKKVHKANYAPIADLDTYSALPTRSLQQIDPFLFLNHHGPQFYQPDNDGLPFGPHPHRGMETVTFIIDGDIMHKDSHGHESVITAGGVQWMTAGRGLIHAEVSSDNFLAKGGNLEILQLWVNLPSRLKMTEPKYIGLQQEDIPSLLLDGGKVKLNAISGNWEEKKGAFETLTEINLSTIQFKTGGKYNSEIPMNKNIFLYIIKGSLQINSQKVPALHLLEFNNDHVGLKIEALEESTIILGYAEPFNEPLVAQGPFVMNSEAEIIQAYEDYRKGKFGTWVG